MRRQRDGDAPIRTATCAFHELHATSIRVLSAAATPLPFPLADTNTHLDTRLNHRPVDLRTPLTGAVLRILSAVCQIYRGALLELDFAEVHTPKLIAAASEGGSAVFKVDYFGTSAGAYLAQSPQLYKQMCLNGDAMRVFEIGPVFRAEQSLTHRHLTEFTGLDAEMVIEGGYTEVLDVLEHVMCRVLASLTDPQLPYAALVARAVRALQEQQADNNSNNSNGSNAAASGVGGEAAAPSPSSPSSPSSSSFSSPITDIVCEVPAEVVRALGLGIDGAGGRAQGGGRAATASADKYGARVGGGRLLNVAGDCIECPSVLRLAFDDAVRMLRDDGAADADADDFTLPQERRLGELVRRRYGVDLYVVDQWPATARPFYTMPITETETETEAEKDGNIGGARSSRTRSYDMYLRGEEICSGAQRQHDAQKLLARLAQMGIRLDTAAGAGLREYVESFKYGAWPHGGFGLGLERIVAFFLGARDIRQVSLFPRDPKRLTP